jgi:protoporphyrinogen/coproporphyrinogen III oxidase
LHVVIIVGGGISGLSAALELATRRVPFILLEASDRIGGLVRTERVNGFTIDSGADSMLAAKPAAVQLCEVLGLGRRLMTSTPPRTAYVHARGRLYPLPSPSIFGIPTTPSAIAAYELLPESARLELAAHARGAGLAFQHRPGQVDTASAGANTRPDPGDESVADFYRRHFGPETVGLIAQPLVGGIHAGDVERLSVGAVAPRLVSAARSNTLFTASASGASASDGPGIFRALRGGMGELVDAIERRLPPGSVRVLTSAKSVSLAEGRWRVTTDDGTLDARAVVLATPSHVAARLLEGTDPIMAGLCAAIPYVSTVSIALAWPRARVGHPLAGSGFVVAHQHSQLRISACTWVSSKWEDRAPPGMVLLRAFLGGATDSSALDETDDALGAIAARDLSSVLGISGPPQLVRVHRWKDAGAQHNVGHAARLDGMTRQLERLPGLFVAGSGFRSIGIPDCIADGRAAGALAARHLELESN